MPLFKQRYLHRLCPEYDLVSSYSSQSDGDPNNPTTTRTSAWQQGIAPPGFCSTEGEEDEEDMHEDGSALVYSGVPISGRSRGVEWDPLLTGRDEGDQGEGGSSLTAARSEGYSSRQQSSDISTAVDKKGLGLRSPTVLIEMQAVNTNSMAQQISQQGNAEPTLTNGPTKGVQQILSLGPSVELGHTVHEGDTDAGYRARQELVDFEFAQKLHSEEVVAESERKNRARKIFLGSESVLHGRTVGLKNKRPKKGPLDMFLRK